MAVLSVNLPLLFLLVLMASCYCAPAEFGYSGTFGAESILNITGSGFGTLKQKDTSVSGDVDGFAAAKWNGTVYGGGVLNYNDLYVGGTSSVSKVVEGSYRPGVTYDVGLNGTGFVPRLSTNKESKTTYDTRFVMGEDAKRLAQSYGADVHFNSVSGTPSLSRLPSFLCAMFCIAGVIKTIKEAV